ncbi:hypothetical protein GCM10009610_20270 [Pseudonocardia xinjiangensis]
MVSGGAAARALLSGLDMRIPLGWLIENGFALVEEVGFLGGDLVRQRAEAEPVGAVSGRFDVDGRG